MGIINNACCSELNDTIGIPQRSPYFQEDSFEPLKFFNLNINPFLDNVNPEFFFRTPVHEDAYLKMKKCIEDNIAIGITTAVSGTGKTLLTQILLSELDPRKYKPVIILVYPQISKTGLLKEIISELGIQDIPQRASVHTLVNTIQNEIFSLHSKGIKLVILIDEAHFLSGDALHLLRTLSNIEKPEKKLLTLLLFGEESFLEKLQNPTYKALFSRIFIRASLRPLSNNEVEQYIKFRCLMSGGNQNIFSPKIFPIITQLTKGIPREINRICHNAILSAAAKSKRQIDENLIYEVIEKNA